MMLSQILISIDAARMITLGVFQFVQTPMNTNDTPIITTTGYHLGHQPQQESVVSGTIKPLRVDFLNP